MLKWPDLPRLCQYMPDLPLDGNKNARAIIDTVHTKIEKTGLFKDGYLYQDKINFHSGQIKDEFYHLS